MPVPDVDSGMVWQGFSPATITQKLPKDKTATAPFRFGGSNVWAYTPKTKLVKIKK